MNPKIIGIAAGVGFVLSILIGLIAQNSIVAVFLRGFICAALCAALSAGILFIFEKYLADGSELDGNVSVPKAAGSIIDITLDDEKLPEDKDAPKFNVSDNLKNMTEENNEENKPSKNSEVATQLGDANTSEEQAVAEASSKVEDSTSSENDSFKPMTVAAVTQSSEQSVEKKNKVGDEVLDALPDIGDIEKNSNNDDSVDSFSNVGSVSSSTVSSAPSMSSSKSASFPDGSGPSVKDAATIAQAIRSVLAREDS